MSETAEQYIARLTGYVGSEKPLDILAATPARLADALRGLSDAAADFKPSPDKWSIRQQLAHLADAEIVVCTRLHWAAAEPGKAIVAYDQDKWAATAKYDATPIELSLATFTAARQWTVSLLRKLTPEQWEGYVTHEERGRETVAQTTRLLAGHDRNHLRQIEALLQASGSKTQMAGR